MPRHYLVYADDVSALRGRLNVTRQFTILAATPQKLVAPMVRSAMISRSTAS